MAPQDVKWIVDTSIIEGRVNGNIVEILRDKGHPVQHVAYFKNTPMPDLEFDAQDCVVIYGSHQFNRAVAKVRQYQPGSLGLVDRTEVNAYMSNLPLEWFLNRHGVMTTWAQFQARKDFWFKLFPGERVFVRPNSGFKVFTGTTVTLDEWDYDIQGLEKCTGVMRETPMMVAPAQEIKGEFRFVVAEGKVIAGSEYRWDNVLDIRRDWPQECFDLAEQVAQHEWQVDIAYTCDVALTPEGAKVVEVNSFSCAGLYACDLELVVDGISLAAWREHTGENI